LINHTAVYPQIQQFIHKIVETQFTPALHKTRNISPQSYTQIDHRIFIARKKKMTKEKSAQLK
jgi:hypothetical protein